jgi:hypothetical protein
MKMRLASDERENAGRSAACMQPGAEDVLALTEERERRRIEFRSSLLKARAALARMESREAARRSMRELSAELKERRPARMMAELANAH